MDAPLALTAAEPGTLANLRKVTVAGSVWLLSRQNSGRIESKPNAGLGEVLVRQGSVALQSLANADRHCKILD
jgi:hypothetical protein